MEGNDLKEWLFDIRVLDNNPLYNDNVYRLKFVFSDSYPIGKSCCQHPRAALEAIRRLTAMPEPPEVTFVDKPARPVPMHPHIYSNGIICLDLLGNQGWSPVQSAESICMSIQSMLTSNSKNERPPGDEEFVRVNRQRPRDIEFLYHDNTV